MAWRIEQAKTGRSSCRQCGQQIAKDEHRFGNDDLNATWYHLGCAEAGKPRAFKPFAKEAAALMSKAAPKAKPKQANGGRNAELEARLVANPDDETRAVFADWLQGNGDPWGELIALELAGNESAAKKLFKQHVATLTGGFAPRMFEWDKGFIRRVQLEPRAKANVQRETLEKVLALPAAILLREIAIPTKIDAAFIDFLNKRLSPSVKQVFTWFTNEVAGLALPHLERLDLFALRDVELDAAALVPLFAAKQVPRVKRLSIYNSPLSPPVLNAFLDSKLLRQLEWLELAQNALDAGGVALVTERAAAFEHVAVMRIDGLDGIFKKQYAAWLERANDEP